MVSMRPWHTDPESIPLPRPADYLRYEASYAHDLNTARAARYRIERRNERMDADHWALLNQYRLHGLSLEHAVQRAEREMMRRV